MKHDRLSNSQSNQGKRNGKRLQKTRKFVAAPILPSIAHFQTARPNTGDKVGRPCSNEEEEDDSDDDEEKDLLPKTKLGRRRRGRRRIRK
jgi:hypothetical protein